MKTPLFLAVSGIALLQGCDDRLSTDVEQQSLSDVTPPVISDVILNRNPNPNVPLAAILSLSTDEPTAVTIRIDDGERTWDATSSDGFATDHSLIVLGMRSGRVHHISAVVSDASGNATETRPLALEMPPLPDEIPQPEVLVNDRDRMEPGVTLFDVTRRDDDGENVADYRPLVIVDDYGEVVWYYRDYYGSRDARRLSNGNLLYLGQNDRAIEIDMLGNIVNHWHANQANPDTLPENSTLVDVDTFHHEVSELPNGNFLTLSRDVRLIEDFPTSTTDASAPLAPSAVVGDVIVEFAPDGTVIHEWSLLELLDPYRIGHGSLNSGGNRFQQHYSDLGDEAPPRDWTHSNAVSYDPSDDSFIVSVRFQDAVVKIDRRTGELRWILGTHDYWKEPWSDYLLEPLGDLQWQNHEHGPEVGANGTIVLFDNGNGRASAYQEELPSDQRYSRAVEFAVDADAMTVTQEWAYGGLGDEWFYSRYISDADWLPETGNILVTSGGQQDGADGVPADGDDRQFWVQIFEVTHTEPAEKVFHLVFKDEPPAGYQTYRAQRLPSLYP